MSMTSCVVCYEIFKLTSLSVKCLGGRMKLEALCVKSDILSATQFYTSFNEIQTGPGKFRNFKLSCSAE
ncbi:hypothetical protein DPMN_136032 [Dreissena polymorpha]|uniref:Uncharacterized protein n=1 Tax=Dreissena polymorpha TaxID=45954 RepID=A0A9D4FZ32_DREPO|nr:hypothetical protein DPMN_136032 [Dreissena polymorpha]